MGKFLVQKSSDQTVRLGIEPWADLEILKPKSRALFEYEEPAEIEFSIVSNDRIIVGIFSDLIKVTGNSGEKIFRPPAGKWEQET